MDRANLIFIILIGIIINFSVDSLANSTQKELVVGYYNIQLSGELRNGSKFELLLTTKPYSKEIKKPKFLPEEGYWGTDGRDPDRVIDKLQLTLGGKTISFPPETYSDLGDVFLRGVSLMQTPDGVNFYIEGGDGAGAYKVIFHVRNGKLASRTIKFMNMHGEMDSIATKFDK